MKLNLIILAGMGFLMMLISSCTTGVDYRDPNSNDGLVLSRDKLDHQDFNALAETMATGVHANQNFQNSGIFEIFLVLKGHAPALV